VWGIMARLGLSLLGLVIATVASLLVMMAVWPCITLFIALSVGATALVWRRRTSYKRP
jgi:membrane protein implicated in regulation of membrane protease activity